MMPGSVIYWTNVCGNRTPYDAFWDPAISFNTPDPNLTACLLDTLMLWVPCAFFWLSLVFYAPYVARLQTANGCRTKSNLNIAKTVFGCVLVAVSILDLVNAISDDINGHEVPLSVYLAPIVKIITFVAVTVLIVVEYRKGLHTSGVLFTFWLLLTIAGIPAAKYWAHFADVHRFSAVTFYIYYGFVFIQFILSIFADPQALPWYRQANETEEKKPLLTPETEEEVVTREPCPEASCSFLSNITFSWAIKLLRTGWKKVLVFEDLYDLMENDKSRTLVPKFENIWNKSIESVNAKNRKRDERAKAEGKAPPKPKTPSLIGALLQTTGLPLLLGSFMRFVTIVLEFVNPQLLRLLIAFVSIQAVGADGSVLSYEWWGYVLVLALFVNNVVHSTLMHWQQKLFYLCGQRLRGVVSTIVYRKVLRLSSSSRRDLNVGNIVNLMSVDAQRLQDSAAYFHVIWTTPLMIGLSIYFLWQTIGPSCLAGLAVLVIVLPFNTFYIARKTQDLQKGQMKFKDSRVKAVNEMLSGMKVLKLYAWEPSFNGKICGIREKELHKLAQASYLSAVSSVSWFCLPFLVSLAIFGTYVYISPENILDADKAFVSLSLINLLNMPMVMLPMFLMFAIQAIVSVKRIEKMLLKDEVDPTAVIKDPLMDDAVKIENGTFKWGLDDERAALKNINLKVKEGSLVAVVGQVGCGKSSLVSSMLGELIKVDGSVHMKGSTAYVPQQAWIQNATLRNNILFGKKFHPDLYSKIINACALKPDLDILPGGDSIEIGEKGINLSGGQKQRVSLARSVYQDDDIYILDDPLSAVDAHVGKHIFENVIGPNGLLKYKTRILVTHGVTYLPHVDLILVLRDGEISEQGTYTDLLEQNGAFADFLRTYMNEEENGDEDEEAAETRKMVQRHLSGKSGSESGSESTGRGLTASGRSRRRKRELSRTLSGEMKKTEEKKDGKNSAKLIEEETAEIGSVNPKVILSYVQAGGWDMLCVLVFSFVAYVGLQIYSSIWLSDWSSDKPINGTNDPQQTALRVGVYGGLGGGQMLTILFVGLSVTYGCIRASRALHKVLLERVLHAPVSFFDTTPMGRIVNRFAKDMDIIDSNLPMFVRFLIFNVSPVVSTIIVISYTTPIFLALVLPLAIIYYLIQKVYVKTLRQLKRIDSIRRSPIYSHFDESLVGVATIRAYRQADRFVARCDQLVDESQMAWYPVLICQRWIGVTLEMLGNVVVLFASLFAVLQRSTLTGGLVGLSINYSLQLTSSLNILLRATTELEVYVVAVERVQEYSEVPIEAPWEVEGNKPRLGWPDAGVIELENYSTRYRAGLDLVLKEVSCIFNSEEKVGIVGRTGAGKSSLTLALFRIIESASGAIKIDGVNIAMIGLHDLRNHLTIIPQDPVLFSGTIKYNLDPFGRYRDDELWKVLEQAHLKHFVDSLSEGLSYECGEGGESLSVGQRQLVCLARALLRKSKILVLDEATAAVDMETDDLIQTTIRNEFKNCTVLTIAHRLNTVMDYDRVIVLDKGEIREFDTPIKLLKDKKTIFYGMARDAGLV